MRSVYVIFLFIAYSRCNSRWRCTVINIFVIMKPLIFIIRCRQVTILDSCPSSHLEYQEMHYCLFTSVNQISLNWPLQPATPGGQITYRYNVTQLIKCFIRSAWPHVTCHDHDRYINSFPITVVTSPGYWATTSYPTQVRNLDCVWQCTCYRGRVQCLRVWYFRE